MLTQLATKTVPAADGILYPIQQLVADDLQAVDRCIEKRLHSDVELVNQVSQYIVHSGGKRLRPLLVLLSAHCFGITDQRHIELAAVIEFIHTATLLHDDVIDASSLRRGKKTANAVWGNDASVLVGDFLYSRAFQMMVETDSMRVMEVMADTTNLIAEGEVLQLLNCRNPDTSEAQYLQVIRAKTAKLFEAAARLGSIVNDGDASQEQAIAAFGYHLGTAYQLIDDVLDYRGAPAEIGKNVGDDLAEGKPTLPLIFAMRTGTSKQRDAIRHAINDGGRAHLDTVIDAVESTEAITYTARAAAAEADLAMDALLEVPCSPYRDALEGLAEFAIQRSF